jgi:predicted metal-dependent TIM-barrel fold hydrolase/catechol 2,3-dioxygenase-like lactoylglutathione lyase family enzyme
MEGTIPYIDAHSHLQGHTYNDWELVGSSGIAAMVLSAGNPHDRAVLVEKIPTAEDILSAWDYPIWFGPQAEKKHLYRVFVAVGISTHTKVEQWEKLIEALPEYLRKPNVVAIGETGLDPIHYFGMDWPIPEQKEALAEQVRVAKEMSVPLLLHTPKYKRPQEHVFKISFTDLPPEENYKRHFLEMDLEIINRIGLDHKLLVVDHVDDTVLDFVMKETRAFVGIRVGQTNAVNRSTPEFFLKAVERYGADRLIINSDWNFSSPIDLLAISKTIRGMQRHGMDRSMIKRAVFDNANELYRLGLEEGRKTGIRHIAIVTRDMKRAIDFYGKIFGLRYIGDITNKGHWPGSKIEMGDGGVNVTFLTPKEELPVMDWTGGCLGPAHIGFEVDDTIKVIEALRGEGIEIYGEDKNNPPRFFKFRDPDGVEVDVAKSGLWRR